MAGKGWDMLRGCLGDAQEPCTSIRCGRDEELQAVLSGRFILNPAYLECVSWTIHLIPQSCCLSDLVQCMSGCVLTA